MLVLLCAIAGAACSTRTVIDSGAPAATTAFPKDRIAKGATLAAIGDCASCHTAKDGKPYAGGFPVSTPFGTVYGTNLTPDSDTGLGRWSEAEFRRALREGIGDHGEHLYPAFPYDHFTLLHDDDIGALYAFLMTRDPVRNEVPANTVIVPRAFVAVWKKLYFHPGEFRADPSRDPRLVRGEYLAESLGHCGACHTPRNKLGAEKKDEAYAGGEVGGWHAPALNAGSTSPARWTADAMTAYLSTGIADDHAIAAGPMAGVTRNLGHVPKDDVAAIAAYAVSLNSGGSGARAAPARRAAAGDRADSDVNGARIYAGACGDCHDRGRAADGGALPLQLAIAPTLPVPSNLIHIVRDGIVPQAGERSRWMPSFAGALTDAEMTDLVTFLRANSGYPPWTGVPAAVREAKQARE